MNDLKPVEGAPGLFRDLTGQVYNLRDFTPHEFSGLFKGVEFDADLHWSERFVLYHWYISGEHLPTNRAALQQQVELTVNGTTLVTTSVLSVFVNMQNPPAASVYTRPNYGMELRRVLWDPNSHRSVAEVEIKVRLREQPLEGCGARVHLRGMRRCLVT